MDRHDDLERDPGASQGLNRQQEWQAAGRLAGEGAAAMVGIVGDMHRAISKRVDRHLSPEGRAVNGIHQRIADAVYAGVATSQQAALAAAGEVIGRSKPDGVPPSRTLVGRFALPAVHGLWGDVIAARNPEFAVRMAVRHRGADLAIDRDSVAHAFPGATGDLVVFVHGLSENDGSWWRRDRGKGSYGDRMRRDHRMTPVYVRYNTGLRTSRNGLALAKLLDELVAAWPVPVKRIVLIGHSMGGLVARSACHYGQRDEMDWVSAVTDVVTLGTPHLGAPLEKAVHVTDWLLHQVPETRSLGRMLRFRSEGIHDLRFGHVVDEDWFGHDPHEFMRDRATEVPFLPNARYFFVAAAITRDPRHPLGHVLGDGLVRGPSASGNGRTRRIPFELDSGLHVGGVGHLSLLNHPKVYGQLEKWLSLPPREPAADRPEGAR